MIGKIFLGLWIICFIGLVGNVAAQEKLVQVDESADEHNDAEIFRAVVESMKEWESRKRNSRRIKRDTSRVCYEDVGCFEDTGPFSYLEMLPSSPKEVGTRFFVYGSRKARSVPMEVPADSISGDKARYAIDPDLPTKVIVHGFGSGCDNVWVYEMRSALMSVIECNLVCVDWAPGSALPNYVRAAANTRLVGRQLAKLVRSLNVPLEKVHLIGFSLGAHVAGFAGAELGNVSRITGLDPAGPLFETQDPRARLDESDARYVDVIHSNGEQLILGGLGSWQPMGDADFYPNGGRMQTGCSNIFFGAVSDIIWSNSGDDEGRSLCNHRRAYKLFTDSVSPKCRFPAFPCETGYDGLLKGECFPCGADPEKPCGDMGFYSDSSTARGKLYLVTRDEEPFCAHQYQVRLFNSKGERPVKSYGKLQITLVGEGSLNETFTMTKKDDEQLLVGAILQKIVVPHPALAEVEAIEIKYTAYSGWISSGLSSWNVDKVAIVDSFGKVFSVCKRGLTLLSGNPVYLPIYPGDCNIPQDDDDSPAAPEDQHPAQDKQGGIGPFTKEHNFDNQDTYSVVLVTKDQSGSQSKGLGPFIREHNIKVPDESTTKAQTVKSKDSSEKTLTATFQVASSPWSIVDLANDGVSNSLESGDSERGRGFSGSNFVPRPHTSNEIYRPSKKTTVDPQSEIHEPVLRLGSSKKETGRSLRLPEITEPVLRPRNRQHPKIDRISKDKRHEVLQESPSSTRAFTVQFLPERLAGILAQAERYARQTLLPLISQYTPSFIGGARHEGPKYFPPLGDIAEENLAEELEAAKKSFEKPPKSFRDIKKVSEEKSSTTSIPGKERREREEKNMKTDNRKETLSFDRVKLGAKDNDWVPMNPKIHEIQKVNATKSFENPYDGTWFNEGGVSWTPKSDEVEVVPDTKIENWVPVNPSRSTTERSKVYVTSETAKSGTEKVDLKQTNETSVPTTTERKFIPLTAYENRSSRSKLVETISKTNEIVTTSTEPTTRMNSIIFPYVYERKNDPRTRYIPLVPSEDFGGVLTIGEKER